MSIAENMPLDEPISPALAEAILTVVEAQRREWDHQQRCGARAAERPCVACLEYEADWLAATRAIEAFKAEVA